MTALETVSVSIGHANAIPILPVLIVLNPNALEIAILEECVLMVFASVTRFESFTWYWDDVSDEFHRITMVLAAN